MRPLERAMQSEELVPVVAGACMCKPLICNSQLGDMAESNKAPTFVSANAAGRVPRPFIKRLPIGVLSGWLGGGRKPLASHLIGSFSDSALWDLLPAVSDSTSHCRQLLAAMEKDESDTVKLALQLLAACSESADEREKGWAARLPPVGMLFYSREVSSKALLATAQALVWPEAAFDRMPDRLQTLLRPHLLTKPKEAAVDGQLMSLILQKGSSDAGVASRCIDKARAATNSVVPISTLASRFFKKVSLSSQEGKDGLLALTEWALGNNMPQLVTHCIVQDSSSSPPVETIVACGAAFMGAAYGNSVLQEFGGSRMKYVSDAYVDYSGSGRSGGYSVKRWAQFWKHVGCVTYIWHLIIWCLLLSECKFVCLIEGVHYVL